MCSASGLEKMGWATLEGEATGSRVQWFPPVLLPLEESVLHDPGPIVLPDAWVF